MKAKAKEFKREGAPFDPVQFTATAPSRRPVAQDIEATKPHCEDLIEPRSHRTMDGIVSDLLRSRRKGKTR